MTNSQNRSKEQGRLQEAVGIVNAAICDYRGKLEAIASTNEDLDPVMVEGETATGYLCCLSVSPKDAAKIMLDYDYPIYRILQEDAPTEMWDELGRKFGLATVSSIDL